MQGRIVNKLVSSVVLSSLMMCLMTGTVSAEAGTQSIPELSNEKGDLTIECVYTDKEKSSGIGGVKLEIFQVADMKNESGNVSFSLTDPYKDQKIDFTGMTASQSNIYAKMLSDYQTENNLTGTVKTTDSKGTAVFESLDCGIYLIKQSGSTGMASEYSEYAPFLAVIPDFTEGNNWNYHVVVSPKTTVKKKDSTVPENNTETDDGKGPSTPKTGDDTQIDLWTMILKISIIGVICVSIAMFRSKRKNS